MTPQEAAAAVVYLSSIDSRVTISKEIKALPEVWLHGLKDYTYDQVTWGIREYYGKLAVDNAPALTAAQCRKILQGHKAVIEAKQARIEPAKGKPMPEEVRQKLNRLNLG